MADRVLFRWPGAAIMGDDRPRYASVEPEFIGSPVWGKGGAIAALLARVAEAERLLMRHAATFKQMRLAWPEGDSRRAEVMALAADADAFLIAPLLAAGAPAAPPEPQAEKNRRLLDHLREWKEQPPLADLTEEAAPPSLPPEVQRVLEAASRWVDAAAAPAPEFEPCDACIIYGPDIDNPAKHPQEECLVTEGARLAWSERRVAASTELHASVAALRARKEEQ